LIERFEISDGFGSENQEFQNKIGTAGVVYTAMLGVKSYDYGKIN